MRKITMEPGKKYSGYGYINEYGEMHFEPSQPSTTENRLKVVFSTEDYSIYETGNFFKLSMKLKKDGERSMAYKRLLLVFQSALAQLAKYI